jgi:hypothetical protein
VLVKVIKEIGAWLITVAIISWILGFVAAIR